MKKPVRLFGGIFCLLNATFYILSESIAVHASISPQTAYFMHTVSELGVPIGGIFNGEVSRFSPLYRYMNAALVICGFNFFPCALLCLTEKVEKRQKRICLLFALLASLGIAGVGVFHQGTPNFAPLHNLSAFSAFLFGNIFLLLSGIFLHFPVFSKISRLLGGIGLCALLLFVLLPFTPLSPFQAVFERLTVYPLVIWEFLGGIRLLLEKRIKIKNP